jgi:hypothetical protein
MDASVLASDLGSSHRVASYHIGRIRTFGDRAPAALRCHFSRDRGDRLALAYAGGLGGGSSRSVVLLVVRLLHGSLAKTGVVDSFWLCRCAARCCERHHDLDSVRRSARILTKSIPASQRTVYEVQIVNWTFHPHAETMRSVHP